MIFFNICFEMSVNNRKEMNEMEHTEMY